jgi:hypothetical protein
VLLYHLKNHYALIFAIREWEEIETQPKSPTMCTVVAAQDSVQACGGGSTGGLDYGAKGAELGAAVRQRRRQVLTARRAQRPSAWIDFDEVRGTLLGWTGYKILALELTRRPPQAK